MDEMNDYLFTQLPVTHATTSYDKLEKPDDNGRYLAILKNALITAIG